MPTHPSRLPGALGKAGSGLAWEGCSAQDGLHPPLTPAHRRELHRGWQGPKESGKLGESKEGHGEPGPTPSPTYDVTGCSSRASQTRTFLHQHSHA